RRLLLRGLLPSGAAGRAQHLGRGLAVRSTGGLGAWQTTRPPCLPGRVVGALECSMPRTARARGVHFGLGLLAGLCPGARVAATSPCADVGAPAHPFSVALSFRSARQPPPEVRRYR